MGEIKVAYAITTWNGFFLPQTLASIPAGARVLTVDNKTNNWPLSKGWNFAVDKLLWDEAYDVAVIMNDDVVLRQDTGDLLAWALVEGQFKEESGFENRFPERPELLLLSARHASAATHSDNVDWDRLLDAEPIWQPGPDFSCFAVSRRLGQVIGRFDENYPCWFEDNDTHRRIQLAGFEAGALAPYWHFWNGTTRTDPERRVHMQTIFETSRSHYVNKWGGLPGREIFGTPFNR